MLGRLCVFVVLVQTVLGRTDSRMRLWRTRPRASTSGAGAPWGDEWWLWVNASMQMRAVVVDGCQYNLQSTEPSSRAVVIGGQCELETPPQGGDPLHWSMRVRVLSNSQSVKLWSLQIGPQHVSLWSRYGGLEVEIDGSIDPVVLAPLAPGVWTTVLCRHDMVGGAVISHSADRARSIHIPLPFAASAYISSTVGGNTDHAHILSMQFAGVPGTLHGLDLLSLSRDRAACALTEQVVDPHPWSAPSSTFRTTEVGETLKLHILDLIRCRLDVLLLLSTIAGRITIETQSGDRFSFNYALPAPPDDAAELDTARLVQPTLVPV